MNSDEAIRRAADLGELIVDEIASPDQDWSKIAAWAEQLAAIARGASERSSEGDPPAREEPESPER